MLPSESKLLRKNYVRCDMISIVWYTCADVVEKLVASGLKIRQKVSPNRSYICPSIHGVALQNTVHSRVNAEKREVSQMYLQLGT
jgi:hypothetical protein